MTDHRNLRMQWVKFLKTDRNQDLPQTRPFLLVAKRAFKDQALIMQAIGTFSGSGFSQRRDLPQIQPWSR